MLGANPSSIDYFIALIAGPLLLWVVFPPAKKPETKRPEESGSMTPLAAFGLGAVIRLSRGFRRNCF